MERNILYPQHSPETKKLLESDDLEDAADFNLPEFMGPTFIHHHQPTLSPLRSKQNSQRKQSPSAPAAATNNDPFFNFNLKIKRPTFLQGGAKESYSARAHTPPPCEGEQMRRTLLSCRTKNAFEGEDNKKDESERSQRKRKEYEYNEDEQDEDHTQHGNRDSFKDVDSDGPLNTEDDQEVESKYHLDREQREQLDKLDLHRDHEFSLNRLQQAFKEKYHASTDNRDTRFSYKFKDEDEEDFLDRTITNNTASTQAVYHDDESETSEADDSIIPASSELSINFVVLFSLVSALVVSKLLQWLLSYFVWFKKQLRHLKYVFLGRTTFLEFCNFDDTRRFGAGTKVMLMPVVAACALLYAILSILHLVVKGLLAQAPMNVVGFVQRFYTEAGTH